MSTHGMRALVLVIVMTGCLADTLLLWPPHGEATYPERRRMFADPGGAIEVFVTPASGGEPDAFVLAMFGNGEVADAPSVELAAMLAEYGMHAEVWGVNYAGYGRSAGR